MQPMQLCICSGRQFEDTFQNSFWWQIIQMQPMRLCICSGKRFEEAFGNSFRRKIAQMHPMWLCFRSGKEFKETHENSHELISTNATLHSHEQIICKCVWEHTSARWGIWFFLYWNSNTKSRLRACNVHDVSHWKSPWRIKLRATERK